MIESEAALHSRLSTMQAQIAWPNVNAEFETPYLEVAVFRNVPAPTALGGYHRKPGIYQVTVVTREGVGTGAAGETAEEVADLFPAGLVLPLPDGGSVRIYQEPQIAGGITDQGQYRIPVSIFYSQD